MYTGHADTEGSMCPGDSASRCPNKSGPVVVKALVDSHGNVALRALESRILTHHSFHMAGDRERTATADALWVSPQNTAGGTVGRMGLIFARVYRPSLSHDCWYMCRYKRWCRPYRSLVQNTADSHSTVCRYGSSRALSQPLSDETSGRTQTRFALESNRTRVANLSVAMGHLLC